MATIYCTLLLILSTINTFVGDWLGWHTIYMIYCCDVNEHQAMVEICKYIVTWRDDGFTIHKKVQTHQAWFLLWHNISNIPIYIVKTWKGIDNEHSSALDVCKHYLKSHWTCHDKYKWSTIKAIDMIEIPPFV